MKLTLTAGELARAAAWAAKLAPAKPVVPVLACVLLEAADDHLTISASDFEMFASVTVPAEGAEPGRIAVSAYLLSAVAAAQPESVPVSLSSSGTTLSLRRGRYSATLPVLPDGDWPEFPALGDEIGSANGPELRDRLSRVLPAIAAESKNPALTGVTLDRATGCLIGTDYYRLAVAALPWQPVLSDGDDADNEPLVIPEPLLRLALDTMTSGVSLYSNGGMLTLLTAAHRVTGRLIAERINAGWKDLLTAPLSRTAAVATVEIAGLRQVVREVSAVTGRETKMPPLLRLSTEEESIAVSLADGDSAAGTSTDTYGPVTGEPITTGVTAEILLTALRCLGSPMATITFQRNSDDGLDRPKPFLLRPANAKGEPIDDGYQHLLVTRRIEVPE